MKTCSRCGVPQPVSSFSKRASAPDGLSYSCKSCEAAYGKQRRQLLRSRSPEELEAAAAARGPKKCRRCRKVKPPAEFSRDRNRPDAMGTLCLACTADVTREYINEMPPEVRQLRRAMEYRRNRRAARNRRLRALFGITIEQYEAMHRAQNGVCAICGSPETERRNGRLKRLSVDHCHATGVIRGLLCSACNKGLGSFRDVPELLRRAAAYVEQYQSGVPNASSADVGFIRRSPGQLRLWPDSRSPRRGSAGSGSARSRRVRRAGVRTDPGAEPKSA